MAVVVTVVACCLLHLFPLGSVVKDCVGSPIRTKGKDDEQDQHQFCRIVGIIVMKSTGGSSSSSNNNNNNNKSIQGGGGNRIILRRVWVLLSRSLLVSSVLFWARV